MANDDLRRIEQKCQDLNREAAEITGKNLNAVRTFQQLSNDISEEYKILDQHRALRKELCLELAKLQLQKSKLESFVRQFKNNNVSFQMIKDLVKQTVGQNLMNQRHVLFLALLSVIDSCRRDPIKFNILYHNLSLDAITIETRLAEFGIIDQYDYGLAMNDQSCYQHENSNDVAYWKVLVDAAEQFFDRTIKELEQVSINQILDLFISGSMTSQLAKKSIQDSNAAPHIHVQWNEKE